MSLEPLSIVAKRWHVAESLVRRLARAGRIPGAVKLAGVWLVPERSQKPERKTRSDKGQVREP